MDLKIKYIDETITYDGSQLCAHFAYKNYGIQGDSLVCFEGPCNIPQENMADLEDVIEGEEIYSDSMLHFIGEFFFSSLQEVVLYQRIFASIIKDVILKKTTKNLLRDGDDLFLREKKLSISIATVTGVSTVFHFAMNTDSKNTPVDTISLGELGIEDIHEFANIILEKMQEEVTKARLAVCKVRVK